MEPSDHVPCVVSINTSIPKSSIFRFENYWMDHEHFLAVVAHGWAVHTAQTDSAKILTAKFKNLRRVLKAWQSQLSNLKANIANVKSVLILLGILEEYKDLTVHEWNFRMVLQDKYSSLLHQQQIYWKQRGTLKLVKFGDEGSKFFHAIATIRHRKNLITSMQDANGVFHTNHHTKADILWEAYKDRLGTPNSPEMLYDLSKLLQQSAMLDSLSEPFTHEEIDVVVANFPSDKSPGPDGFNTCFVKKCWPIIKQDFYKLCADFHAGQVCLQSLNGSHITLLPKTDNPSVVSNFRPISLLNTSIKILTKLLANRLQRVIMDIIHKNQYGFIKSRTIQDCLAWAFEYLHLCHKSHKELIILKLDFEKAFDRIEHQAMLQIMEHKGFNATWLQWMSSIFNSGTSAILLNGVRQGDC
jgi:hypothetical protein